MIPFNDSSIPNPTPKLFIENNFNESIKTLNVGDKGTASIKAEVVDERILEEDDTLIKRIKIIRFIQIKSKRVKNGR